MNLNKHFKRARRSYKNVPEEMFCLHAEELGYVVMKRGWPDFIGYKDGEYIAVEVKDTAVRPLKREQVIVMNFLTLQGIKCFTWNLEERVLKVWKPTGKLNRENRRPSQISSRTKTVMLSRQQSRVKTEIV